MQYNTLLTRIAADIYSNGAELITGDILQNVLNEMVGALASAGACYKGTITPASAAPLDLDQPTVYLALTAGTYTNFRDSNNDPIVTTGPALIIYEGGPSLVFMKTDLPFATTSDLSSYLPLAGGTMTGDLDMNGQSIENVGDPVNNGDAANKGYVDSKQPWKVTIEPDADMSYILIRLGEPSHSCILAIDSASGAGALHGILCIDENFDITGAVFVGSGGLDTTVDAKSGYDDNSPRNFIAVLKFSNDQPVTITCIGGNAPQSAEAIDALGGETFTSTRAWTDLETGGGGGGDEQTANKKTDIPANRTSETYYPNTKGVFDLTSKWGVISQTLNWSGSASTGYTYTISDISSGPIPQANIDLFVKAGATFNTSTGYFELNGLTDIAYDEMQDIYNSWIHTLAQWAYHQSPLRTIFPFKGTDAYNITFRAFYQSRHLSVIPATQGYEFLVPAGDMFKECSSLKKVSCKLLGNNSAINNATIFANCPMLEEISVFVLNYSLNLSSSPNFKPSSLATIINGASTGAITITLHATAYAAAQADAGVQAALSSKTNVSLASA